MNRLKEALDALGLDKNLPFLPGAEIVKISAMLNLSLPVTMARMLENNIWPLRFARNKTIFSSQDQIRVMSLRPLIVGCGGLGGHVASLLVRLGVCNLRICDPDVFEESNLNRQLFCTEKTIGQSKVAVAAKALLEVSSWLEMEALEIAATPENLPQLLQGVDIAIDCLDSVSRKKMLASAAEKAGLPYLHGAVLEQEGFVSLTMPGSAQLEKLYPDINAGNQSSYTSHTLATTVEGTAALMVSLLINNLVLGQSADSSLLHLDLTAPSLETFII